MTALCRSLALLSGVLLMLALTVPCAAFNEYLPLELGYWWEYELPSGIETRTVDRVVDMRDDYVVYAIVTTGTTPNAGLEEYWTNGGQDRDDEDDAKLYGFYHVGRDSGRTYAPAIRMVRHDLTVGDSWHDNVHVYEQPGNIDLGEFRFEHVVEDTGTIVVPAGAFRTASVLTTETPIGAKMRRPSDPTGRSAASPGSRSGKTWWARDIGEVSQEVGGVVAVLRGYDALSPVEPESWGRIKALFR